MHSRKKQESNAGEDFLTESCLGGKGMLGGGTSVPTPHRKTNFCLKGLFYEIHRITKEGVCMA